MQQYSHTPKVVFASGSEIRAPSFYETEDLEGTEELLRKEIKEGWQESKGEKE